MASYKEDHDHSDEELLKHWKEEISNVDSTTKDISPQSNLLPLNYVTGKMIKRYKSMKLKAVNFYPMTHIPRGNVIVINNEMFTQLSHRRGTELDRRNIASVFSQLGFSVIIYNNLTYDEMVQTLEKESRNDYSNHDCFILFILSHGDRGVVYGTDGYSRNDRFCNSVELEFIRDLFCQNKTLANKPKLFFIQACQGKKTDSGLMLPSPRSTTPSSQTDFTDHSDDTYRLKDAFAAIDTSDVFETIPLLADTFVSIATAADFVSWRHIHNGSLFIRAVCFVFRRCAFTFEMNDLLRKVNFLMSKYEATSMLYKQVPEKKDTCSKKLWFFPWLSDHYVELYEDLQREKENNKKQEKKIQECYEKIGKLKEKLKQERIAHSAKEKRRDGNEHHDVDDREFLEIENEAIVTVIRDTSTA